MEEEKGVRAVHLFQSKGCFEGEPLSVSSEVGVETADVESCFEEVFDSLLIRAEELNDLGLSLFNHFLV